ncbi:hypothetical protein ACFSTA_18815 [Ornithinibacillus salinisoli]|uniref:Uncharacterized protein n=1 Tax=Ornithinibacillus salinisoli TaxID=1848459 RepID=A0ABW4W6D0_9BACI
MLKENEILLYLINHSRYGVPFYLTFKENIANDLETEGYVQGEFYNFTDKAKTLLDNYYYQNKDRVIGILKVFDTSFSYETMCSRLSLSPEDLRGKYLIERLAEDNIISISASTNWQDRIKILFN